MNKRQLVVLWVGIGLAALMAIVPPWCAKNNELRVNVGYGLIFRPPHQYAQVDVSRLLVQWAVVGMVAAGLMVTFRRRGGGSASGPEAPGGQEPAARSKKTDEE